MCGIIGITSNKPVSSSILNSLKKLEYRGYDSAGIATINDGLINEVKCQGRVDVLEKNISQINLLGNVGIGHVRWATHGMPSTVNAHPHSTESISVVHNGIIENSAVLKKQLIEKGHFGSERIKIPCYEIVFFQMSWNDDPNATTTMIYVCTNTRWIKRHIFDNAFINNLFNLL